jgi:ferritin-like metal-binding protein YciE
MADLNTLAILFEDELRDVYDAKKQILKALPKIMRAPHSGCGARTHRSSHGSKRSQLFV